MYHIHNVCVSLFFVVGLTIDLSRVESFECIVINFLLLCLGGPVTVDGDGTIFKKEPWNLFYPL